MTDNPKFYTVPEVAAILRITNETVRHWIKDEKIKAFKAGRSWRVSHDDLQAFVAQHTFKEDDE